MKKNLCHFSLLIICAAILLVGCTSEDQRQWLEAPGWSRAVPVGIMGTADPVPVAVDASGQIYLAWFADVGGGELMPRVAAFNRALEPVWQTTIASAVTIGDDPLLVWDGELLNLFWLSDRALYFVALNGEGAAPGGLQVLSGDIEVDDYAVALSAAGELTIWYGGSRRSPGLYALAPGRLSAPALVDAEGIRPSLQYDDNDVLHVSWAHYPPSSENIRFFYATYDGGAYEPGREIIYRQPSIPVTTILEGPLLGLTDSGVYSIWSLTVRAGMENGRVDTSFMYFDYGQVDKATKPAILVVPQEYNLDYEAVDDGAGRFVAGPRFPLTGGDFNATTNVSDLAVVSGSGELALAFNAQIDHLYRKVKGQVGLAFFRDGGAVEYQLLSFSAPNSTSTFLARDGADNLYMTWQENVSAGNAIYLASSAVDIVAATRHLTGSDFSQFSAQTIFGLLSGALLAPFAIAIWLIAPLVLIIGTGFLRRERGEQANVPGTVLTLGLAIIAYWVGKLISLPGLRTYVPFSAWLPNLPNYLDDPLRVSVPIVITVLAAYLAYQFTYRRSTASALYFLLIFALIDGLVTMSIYGLLILGGA